MIFLSNYQRMPFERHHKVCLIYLLIFDDVVSFFSGKDEGNESSGLQNYVTRKAIKKAQQKVEKDRQEHAQQVEKDLL